MNPPYKDQRMNEAICSSSICIYSNEVRMYVCIIYTYILKNNYSYVDPTFKEQQVMSAFCFSTEPDSRDVAALGP